MHEPAVLEENANYATQFPTESMGTEEELHDAMVGMAENAPTIFAVVYDENTGAVLLELTKDLQQYKNQDRPGHGFFTLEIRTTPAELTDRAAWDNRTRALQVTIWAIEDAHGKALAGDSYGGYRREIRNTDHVIHRGTPNQKITGTDRHLTVGVPATALATTPNPTMPGQLHDLVALPWYEPTFAAEPAVSGYTKREKTVYAVILSAVLRLARSFTARNEYNVDNVKVKDARSGARARRRWPCCRRSPPTPSSPSANSWPATRSRTGPPRRRPAVASWPQRSPSSGGK
jgi:hypothetical protein